MIYCISMLYDLLNHRLISLNTHDIKDLKSIKPFSSSFNILRVILAYLVFLATMLIDEERPTNVYKSY